MHLVKNSYIVNTMKSKFPSLETMSYVSCLPFQKWPSKYIEQIPTLTLFLKQ